MKRFLWALAFLLSRALLVGAVEPADNSGQWGDLVLRIRVTDVPDEVPRDEAVVIDRQSGGLANVMVWVRHVDRVHSSYETTPKTPIEVKLVEGRIVPHVTFVRTRQTLLISAADE